MTNTTLEKWEEKTLVELCNIEIGKTPSRSNIKFWDKTRSTNNTWLSIADLNNTQNKKVFSSKEQISDLATQYMKLVKEGTLLLSFKLTIGRVAFAGKDLYTNEAIAQLPIKNEQKIDKHYLYYYLQYFDYEELLKGDVKVKGKTLNKEKLKGLPVCYPPLPEQERIVAKLDKAFEAIDKVKANAEQNLTNTKELFESALSNIFINLNFKPIKLCELTDVNSGYAFKSNSFTEKGEYQVLRLGNVKQGFLRLSANPVYVNNMTKDILEKSLLSKGDAVITQTGTKNKRDYGFVAIVDKDDLLLNQRLAMVKFKEKLLPQYFYYYSYTSTYKDDFFANEGGAVGQGNIGLNDIKNLTIPYVSLSEQQKIVEKLDTLQEQTKHLEQIYIKKIKECDELKQSILQKAFRGEL